MTFLASAADVGQPRFLEGGKKLNCVRNYPELQLKFLTACPSKDGVYGEILSLRLKKNEVRIFSINWLYNNSDDLIVYIFNLSRITALLPSLSL